MAHTIQLRNKENRQTKAILMVLLMMIMIMMMKVYSWNESMKEEEGETIYW